MPASICRHVRANGTRCGSPALRGQPLCYFHRRERLRYPNRPQAPAALTPAEVHLMHTDPLTAEYYGLSQKTRAELDFPPLEDRASIQVALSMLVAALGRGQVDSKRAGLMLYGLQVASANVRNLEPAADSITEVIDEDGHDLAPDEDPQQELGSAAKMLLALQSIPASAPE